MQKPLDIAEIHQGLHSLNNWTLEPNNDGIQKDWEFESFKRAVEFFVRVSELAEALDHHPEVLSSYKKMRIRLTTHDASGLTHRDFELAARIDALYRIEF